METYKDIFNEQTLQYVTQVFELFSSDIIYNFVIPIVWSFVAFFLAIIVLFILKKKHLFRRDNKIWNLIAKLHYPIWIILFVTTGFFYGTINAFGAKAETILEETVKPYIEASVPILYQELLSGLPVSSPDENITIRNAARYIMKDFEYVPKTDSKIESLKSKMINWGVDILGEQIIINTVNALVTKAIHDVGVSMLHLSDEDLKFNQTSLLDVNLSQSDKSIAEVVYRVIDNKLDNFISGIKLKLFVVFFIAILVLLLEPLFYYIWCKKMRAQK
jgi:hypothetical protein